MTSELRYDRGMAESFGRSDGFLRAKVSIARAGVFPYLTPSGKIRMEAKLPEDLFSDFTINSAKGAPVTDGHPPASDNSGMVNAENWQKYVKGSLGDSAEVTDGLVNFSETIFDSALIADLEAGHKVEVSIGFRTDVDYTPGEYEGERYDAVQRNIIINHVAHVDRGRGGESVRAYLDSKDGVFAVMQGSKKTTVRRDSIMNKFFEALKKLFTDFGLKVDGDEDEVSEDTAGKGGKEDAGGAPEDKSEGDNGGKDDTAKIDSASELLRLHKQIKEQSAKIDALEALGKIREDKSGESKRFDEAVSKRLALLEAAKSVIPDIKYDSLTSRAVKLAVIERLLPYAKEVKTDSLEDVFIDARYDAAMSLAKEKAAIYPIGSAVFRSDDEEIAKKKERRLNMMEAK